NTSVPEEIEGLMLQTETRHNDQKEKLREAKKKYQSSGDEQKDVVELQRRESILEHIAAENKEWNDSLNKLVHVAQKNDVAAKEHQVTLEELNGRINDLLKLKHLFEQKANKVYYLCIRIYTCTYIFYLLEEINRTLFGNNCFGIEKETKPEDLQKSGEVLLSSLNDRHREAEGNVEKMLAETKTNDEKHQERLAKLKENNDEWKDAMTSSVNTVADIKAADAHAEQNKMTYGGWIEMRKEESTLIPSLSRQNDDPIVCLYTPQPKLDKHHMLSALYDCELLCELVNLVEADFVDARVIHKPDALKPYPISNKYVKENVQLLIASLKAFGIHIDHGDDVYTKWSDIFTHFELLQKVIDELHTKKLKAYVNLKETPEIKDLKDANESEEDIGRIPPQEWLKRWLNHRSGKPVLSPISDYTEALYETMKCIDPAFASSAPAQTFSADPTMASQHMVRFARTKLNINVYLQANDLVAHHQKLQELFAAQIFEVSSGLEKKSKAKKPRGSTKLPGSADDGMISFINSVLPPEQQINELTRDMSDGLDYYPCSFDLFFFFFLSLSIRNCHFCMFLLHSIVLCRLLEKMKPGCIQWKAVQIKPRQKFDKIGNCNYAMTICSKEFPFSLVGIGGDDIHNGNQKMVRSLLWQMMRYWSTKKLSELSFGGKDVKDEDILQWANLTISGLRDRHSSEIRSFRDKKLTTGLFYLELLKAVLGEEHVRNDLIYFNIPVLSNPRAPDEHNKERLANARYAMTIIRMNGADLFILPEDLIGLDSKAVLSTLAAIMTIAFTQDKIEHETAHEDAGSTAINDLLNG
ncbi:fimbrin-like protein, partial [Reticulomyxa filosa]